MRWKRPLFLFHRWAGIVLCLFFAAWFLSGLFMMYVEFPQLTDTERRAGAATLDFSGAKLTPGEVLDRLQARHFSIAGTPNENTLLDVLDPNAPVTSIDGMQLGMLWDRPVYHVYVSGAQPRVVFADTGELLQAVTPELALESARDFAARTGQLQPRSIEHRELLQTDQWTVSAGLNAHRPLHRIVLNDARRTELYVSSSTGEVVRDTQRRERLFNYFGAVTHWLYPTFIRRYPDAWAWMVDVLSTAGAVLALSGLWVGILRWRRRREPNTSLTPYSGIMRWHHLTGLVFGITTVTWVCSGLLSMNPGKINPSRSPSSTEALAFSGKPLTPADFAAFAPLAATDPVEAELVHVFGKPFYRVVERAANVQLLSGGEVAAVPSIDQLLHHTFALMPGIPRADAAVLTSYDNYYYSRRPEQGGRPLPVIRARFLDTEHTWFYVDPISGQVLERSTRFNRLYRWLYNGLHSFDIQWLWNRRPLWDITVIVFSLGGFALSSIGVIVGVRRLRWAAGIAPLQPRHARAQTAAATIGRATS